MKTLAAWLKQGCGAHHVSPLIITIGGQQWEQAAYYVQTVTYTSGALDCVRRGEKEADTTLDFEAIYVVGPLPRCYQRHADKSSGEGEVCFPWRGQDWYVAGYQLAENIGPENKDLHPFGVHFILMPWDASDGKAIDAGCPTPYARFPMTVE